MLELSNIDYFANLTFSGIELLIPQGDIYSLEPSIDMKTLNQNGSVGQLQQMNSTWSLYALSANLDVLSDCPETYRIAVLLKNVQPFYGLLCEQITTIASTDLTIQSIPTAMYNQDSPLLALALYGEQVRYVSSATALSKLFS